MLDLDPETVTLKQYNVEKAREESEAFFEKKESGDVKIENGIVIEADW